MKKLILALPLAMMFAGSPVAAAIAVSGATTDQANHSGGCRKDSPAGQCCHAGSKPYHCH